MTRRETKKTVIGKLITHKHGSITIKDFKGNNGLISEFIAECSVCSLDKELWPYGSLVYDMVNINRNSVLCGCGRKTFQHLWQLELLVERLLVGGDLKFKGWEGGTYKDYHSKVILESLGGKEWKVSVGNLRKQTLPIFSKEYKENLRIQKNLKDLESHTSLPKHYKYIYKSEGCKNYGVVCCVCNSDPMFKVLGSKTYLTKLSSLKKGRLPCRCSPTYPYSQQEWILRLTSEFNKREIDVPNYPKKLSSRVRLDWICANGHECSTQIGAIVQGVGCPECTESGGNTYGYYRLRVEEEDCLYLIRFESPCKDEVFYKVGRSFNLKSRMAHMKKYYNLKLISTFKGKHQEIYNMEQELHKTLNNFQHYVKVYFQGCVDECFSLDILEHPEIKRVFNL